LPRLHDKQAIETEQVADIRCKHLERSKAAVQFQQIDDTAGASETDGDDDVVVIEDEGSDDADEEEDEGLMQAATWRWLIEIL
jgi:hypothetical protein